MSLLDGKKALILGVANERSIAWGIAKTLRREGAELGFTYQNDAIKKRLDPLVRDIDGRFCLPLDVENESHFPNIYNAISDIWGTFDILIHSLAYAEKEALKKRFSDLERSELLKACDVSAFSLVKLAGVLKNLMNPDSSIIAMTYQGAFKVMRNYSLMGVAKAALESSIKYLADDLGDKRIRVNGISSGPIRTLAASGIDGARAMIKESEERSPLHVKITPEDVGETALYLSSNMSKKITGQIIYVDAGFSIMGI